MQKEDLYLVRDLHFSYSLGSGDVEAICGLSMEIPPNSFITISGPSGSGKSTLLNILGLIEPIQGGSVLFRGEDIRGMSEGKKNEIRKRHIGFIFQQFHLIPVLSAAENVGYFLLRQGLSKKAIEERVEEALQIVGLWDHRTKKPAQLSGGQKQRVAIARAIAKQPDVIIGDEPTASLDQKNGHDIMKILARLVEEKKSSVVLTTHDPMVQAFSQQNIHIQDGKIVG